jgi:hypothetical protein
VLQQERLHEDDPDEQRRLKALITPTGGSAKAAIAACLAYCWLYGTLPATGDADLDLPRIIFVPFPYQERALALSLWLQLERPDLGKDFAILKSRQTGLTSLFLHRAAWRWHVAPTRTGLGSRAESEVDKNPGTKNPHTLLGRVEAIVTAEPPYLRPKGFDLANKTFRQMLEFTIGQRRSTVNRP